MNFGNFRDIITISKLDMCSLQNKNAMTGAFKKEVESINRQLGYLLKPCPWKTIEATNASFSYREDITYEEIKKFPRLMPNGEYRVHARLFNDRDDNIATIRFIVTLKVFTNEDPF